MRWTEASRVDTAGALMRLDLSPSMFPPCAGMKPCAFTRKRLCALHLEARRCDKIPEMLDLATTYLAKEAARVDKGAYSVWTMLGIHDKKRTVVWDVMRRAMVPENAREACLFVSLMHTKPLEVLDACCPEWVCKVPHSVPRAFHYEVSGLRARFYALH